MPENPLRSDINAAYKVLKDTVESYGTATSVIIVTDDTGVVNDLKEPKLKGKIPDALEQAADTANTKI